MKLIQKIKSCSGESIAETLVALLISAISLTMLASMISTTVSIVKQSEKKMEAYYTENTRLEKLDPDSSSAQDLNLELKGTNLNVTLPISYESNEEFRKYTVIAYNTK